ncbi:ATP-binding cassette domain-containing protein [Dysgonomonas sp. 216]|uniref:ATP-binding cassette domain-containing protein n=1 Tax=Dysgonomonas sp. 216 TaxID=2302934 RepID=UPI0013D829AC|nr:ATP-binding cassette domain-containing protein [Dysgonomonas sp. 216]NDW19352.1 ATP-binding cassette domain-containing protein [Dysgonomonas sp. 216]
MEDSYIIQIENAIPRLNDIAFAKAVNWTIKKDEHWAIIGPNGAGKTLLIDLLTGKYALKSGIINCKDETGHNQSISTVVKSMAFRDIYSMSDLQNSYYQQRWNAGDVHQVPLVRDMFGKGIDKSRLDLLIESFSIEDLLDKEINLLSSGELRKFLIVRALINRPKILILDNPFIGLDNKSRAVLNAIFKNLVEFEDLQLVLVLSNPNDIPDLITHVLPIKEKRIGKACTKNEFFSNEQQVSEIFPSISNLNINGLAEADTNNSIFENALMFKKIHIKYGNRTILNDVNWTVKRGEKWALLGENGSGKSTLLSLVSGDNPQAYANDITLFDRKRGSGESIWDIKKHIGYISPEMHLYYLKNVRCIEIVASGFFDTIGLYRKCNSEQIFEAEKWMDIFGISYLKNTSFLNVSTGEQRLVLLARVFVKNPSLLILDEPLHGLDVGNKIRVKQIIEEFCNETKSLIYVTHYENEIPSVVDKRLVLNKYQNNDKKN